MLCLSRALFDSIGKEHNSFLAGVSYCSTEDIVIREEIDQLVIHDSVSYKIVCVTANTTLWNVGSGSIVLRRDTLKSAKGLDESNANPCRIYAHQLQLDITCARVLSHYNTIISACPIGKWNMIGRYVDARESTFAGYYTIEVEDAAGDTALIEAHRSVVNSYWSRGAGAYVVLYDAELERCEREGIRYLCITYVSEPCNMAPVCFIDKNNDRYNDVVKLFRQHQALLLDCKASSIATTNK